MEIRSTSCAYHSGKAMVAICQNCRSPICELDVNKFQDNNGSIFSTSQTYDLCYFCYKKRFQQRELGLIAGGLLSAFIILAFSFTVLFILPSSSTQPGVTVTKNVPLTVAFGLLGILLLIAVIVYFVNNKNKVNEAYARYSSEPVTRNAMASDQNRRYLTDTQEDDNSFDQTMFSTKEQSLVTTTGHTICFTCGDQLSPDDIFFSHCGALQY